MKGNKNGVILGMAVAVSAIIALVVVLMTRRISNRITETTM